MNVDIKPYRTIGLACLNRGMPTFHYMLAAVGGHDISCASYAANLQTQHVE